VLQVKIARDTPIFISASNYKHIFEKHEEDFVRFGGCINEILKFPDYVGINPKDNSIEYIKEFKIENEHIKVAVRVSKRGNYWVRSMYSVSIRKIKKFIKTKRLKKI
jgi:hypothetical protein